jgi:hypothetical protein
MLVEFQQYVILNFQIWHQVWLLGFGFDQFLKDVFAAVVICVIFCFQYIRKEKQFQDEEHNGQFYQDDQP